MSSRTTRFALHFAALAALMAVPADSHAQFGRLGEAAKRKAEQIAEEKKRAAAAKANAVVDDKIADTEAKIGETVSGSGSAGSTASGSNASGSNASGSKASGSKASGSNASGSNASGSTSAGGRNVWTNFDFVPGERTLFFTDFTDEEVGNFPQRLEFKSGSMEIVELDGQRALKASTKSGFVIPLKETLPQKFTLEFDVIHRNTKSMAASTIVIYGGTVPKTDVDVERTRIGVGHTGWEVSRGGANSEADFTSDEATNFLGQQVTVRALVDGSNLKLYVDGRRLTNVPNANFLRGRGLYIALMASDHEANAVYVTGIRVAESQKSVYDALMADGRWATQGILFATAKSTIRPESGPTLKQIAAALQQNPALRVRIEGHTDGVGNADANMQLSEARATAVKNALVKDHGIDGSRLETAGLGATKPVGDNSSAEGRSNNRRVEVVKL